MIVLGIDASSSCTGWALIDSVDDSLIACGEFQLEKFKKKRAPLEYMAVLYSSIFKLCEEYQPAIIYLEDTYGSKNRSLNTLKVLSRVRGVVEIACIHAGHLFVHMIESSRIRKSVLGQGDLDKQQICSILETKYQRPIATKGYDASDAVLVALCGALKTRNAIT